MGNLVYPFIPVLVHEVVDDTSCGEGQVGVLVYGAGAVLYGHHEEHLALVGREGKSFEALLCIGELSAVATVGVHLPQLVAATSVAQEGQFGASLDPYGIALIGGRSGKHALVLALGVHGVEHAVALVLGYAVVRYTISDGVVIGRYAHAADAAHSPKGFGSHTPTLNLDLVLTDETGLEFVCA